jgi:hypothetical protein
MADFAFCYQLRATKIRRMLHDNCPLTMLCHPATPAPVVRSLEAQVAFQSNGALAIAYRLWGDMIRLRIPQNQPVKRTDFLWEHTCFEAFIAVRGETAYREFNFSPSGQWAAYAFSDYRQRNEVFELPEAPQITARLFAGRLEVDVILPPNALPITFDTLQIGLSAVVESADTVDGSHSYWALHHPGALPDFHHRAAFILELAASRNLV